MNSRQKLTQTIQKIEGAYAPATIRAYRVDFEKFIQFCESRGHDALPAPPIAVAGFISLLANANLTSASIRRAVAGLSTIHKLNRCADPTKDPEVTLEMRRMHRTLGRAAKQAHGITKQLLDKLLDATDDSLRGVRDRALLLVAYDTLCRRSELVSLRVEDVTTRIQGGVAHTTIGLRRSKTDQHAAGCRLHLHKRAQLALKAWMDTLGTDRGFLFRGITSDGKPTTHLGAGQVNRIYKRLARMAEVDSSTVVNISGHSMRVGAAQDLVHSGASLPIIMSKGRWSKVDTVMRYVEQISYSV